MFLAGRESESPAGEVSGLGEQGGLSSGSLPKHTHPATGKGQSGHLTSPGHTLSLQQTRKALPQGV